MKQFPFILCLLLLALASCTDPITVGADILRGDQADVGQINDLPMTVRTVREDSLAVFAVEENAFRETFSFGRSEDDIFGTWTQSVAIAPGLQQTTGSLFQEVIVPEFVENPDANIDSIVLILPIDTFAGFYGPGRTFNVTLSRLIDPIPTDQDIFSSYDRPLTGSSLTDDASFVAKAEATILYDTIYSDGDTVSLPHVRLRLNQSFVDVMNTLDSTNYVSDTVFRETFAGVYLEPNDDVDGFFTIRPRGTTGTLERSGFYFFYPDPSDNDPASFYRVPFNGWFPRYSFDFAGTLAGELLNGDDSTQTLVGGTGAYMTEITFTDLDALQDKLINRAEITFYRELIEDYDYGTYPAPSFLGLYYRNNSGDLVNILDQELLQNNTDAVRSFLGGFAETDADDDTQSFYQNRLSVHMQGIIDGDFAEPKIYLRVVPIASDPSRAVLSGPAATSNGASNVITFTNIQ
ncbi:DUF4270 family protein [Lewinella sp. 4G2]|uniref:DUF4270 family protein n=1 Tax=Lewinella sp. 4G2 TaxID=1803372 RepID=UPI0007E1E218|nr:DUF4270 family protein [Lewinella sp. 4G2]OAV46228.1 hypothetical protein A3850_018405 [Lewinella sp. 4G2]